MSNPAATPVVRISSGSREVDEVLGGGLPENSINIVMGEPGSGKTTLAEAFLFANANDAKRPVLFLTTLSEPLEKVIRYGQQYRYFDADKIGTTVLYDSIAADLVTSGVSTLVPKLKEAIKAHSPRLIVIDSFKVIHDLAKSPEEVRLMLHEAAGLLTAYNVTVLLVGEYRHDDIARYPEFAVADGIIELARNALGSRDERYLRVFKLRGSSYREGSHAFEISSDGLQVYPRLVSPVEAASYQRSSKRASSGVPGLDAMFAGGVWQGSATLVAGPTGSGKTTMGIQFVVEGLKRGERCLLVNFQENPTQLAHQLEQIGGKLDAETRERLQLQYHSAVELPIDRIVVSIFKALRRSPIHRVVIDAVGDLAVAANDAARLHDYLYAMGQHFAVMGVSSLLTLEVDAGVEATSAIQGRLSHMTDNIVYLTLESRSGTMARSIRVAKARGLGHDLQPSGLQIDARGLQVIERS